MNDEINEALRQFNREDLIDDGYERDLDSNIEVFLTIKQMIYYNQLQSNWNSLREWLESRTNNFQEDVSTPILHEQIVCSLILDKMNELEGKDKDNGR